MDKFSLYKYNQLPDSLKVGYNKALAWRLKSMLDDIKNEDDSYYSSVKEFVESSGRCSYSETVVQDLYSKISSCIQVGSGNQNLFLSILSEYTACWETINRC